MISSASITTADDIVALRAAIARIASVGYGEMRVRERLGLTDINDLTWQALPIYRQERLLIRDPLAAAIDLLLLQGTIPLKEVEELCGQCNLNVLMRIGLLSINEHSMVHAHASLFPVGNDLIFSEHAWPTLPHPGLSQIPQDQVMSVGADSRWLARATIRHPVDTTLDLCTGSGIQALLAAAHSRSVIAIDINPRAILYTKFNIQALGLTNVDAIVGNLYEPVHGARFDLITANPPFVPSPVNSVRFRDGGCSGEDIQRQIIIDLPRHLAAHGIAQIVTELGEGDGESLADRLRRWLGDAPMDIHILRLREYSMTAYALGHAEGKEYGAFLDSVHNWYANLRHQGYTRIVALLLTVQWSANKFGQAWMRSDESDPPQRYDAGVEIEKIFAAERLVRHPDFQFMMASCQLQRADKIKIFEVGVLGEEAQIRTNAQLLDSALPIHQWINPIEREILVRMKTPVAFTDIFTLASDLDLDNEIILIAVHSLLRRRLIVARNC